MRRRGSIDMTTNKELFSAIFKNDFNTVSKMLESGTDPNSVDEDGFSLLMNAILADTEDTRIVSLILSKGADVNYREPNKWTALHFAARDQKIEAVKLLLDHGADVNAKEEFGNTPLDRNITVCRDNHEIAKMLLDRGADPSIKNNYGSSAIDYAKLVEDDELLKLLTGYDD
jgi:ankyrin repeat protein